MNNEFIIQNKAYNNTAPQKSPNAIPSRLLNDFIQQFYLETKQK